MAGVQCRTNCTPRRPCLLPDLKSAGGVPEACLAGLYAGWGGRNSWVSAGMVGEQGVTSMQAHSRECSPHTSPALHLHPAGEISGVCLGPASDAGLDASQAAAQR